MSESLGGRFETFEANDRFVVVRDEEGYGVWRMDDLEDGEPIERFLDDERGYEAATLRWKELSAGARRDVWLGRLRWIVLVSALLWALSGALTGVLIFEVSSFDGRGLFQELFKWAQVANAVAMPLTVGGFAVYVVLWLESRRDR